MLRQKLNYIVRDVYINGKAIKKSKEIITEKVSIVSLLDREEPGRGPWGNAYGVLEMAYWMVVT